MKKTFGALLFVFVTGVILACIPSDRLQAQDFYGKGNVLVAVDMSEYTEKHTVAKLIGSPAWEL